MNNYETVFIVTPVLSDAQVKEVADKFQGVITENGGQIVNSEAWGLKKLAYPIQKKTTGFYFLIEFTGELNQEVESGGLLLNRVGELLQAPGLAVHNLTAVFGNYTLEFVSDLLDLCIGKDRRDNENGFVIVHNRLLIRLICI